MSWRSISPTSWTASPIAGIARAAETAVTSLLSEVIAIYCTTCGAPGETLALLARCRGRTLLVHRSRDPRGVVLGANLTVKRRRPEGPGFLLSFRIADLPLLPRSTMSRGRSTCLASIKSYHAIGGRRRHAGAANPGPGCLAEGRPWLGSGGTVVGELDSRHEDPGHTPTSGTRPPIIRSGWLRARCAAMAARGPPTNPWNQGSPAYGTLADSHWGAGDVKRCLAVELCRLWRCLYHVHPDRAAVRLRWLPWRWATLLHRIGDPESGGAQSWRALPWIPGGVIDGGA